MQSLRTRLALGFFGIAAAAIALVLFLVIPGLQTRLREAKLADLATTAGQFSPRLGRAVGTSTPAPEVTKLVTRTGDAASTRVTVLLVTQVDDEVEVVPQYDSFADARIDDLQFGVAQTAARLRRPTTGTEASSAGPLGQAAVPLFQRDARGRRIVGYVAVFSTPLRDVEASVAVVRRRVLLAGLLAAALALVAGAVVARRLSTRVRRIEAIAGRVARGDFSARFPVDQRDELGELARELDDMRRQLEELDSARKRFIATASHELRTPIFSLGGFLELLADEELDPETRAAFLAQTREQVARLGKLALDLLDLSRLEAGSLELRRQDTDLREVARTVADEFIPALGAHGSQLELRLPPDPVQADCDPERVAQVVRILVDNALTHTPEGTAVVLSAARRDGHVRMGVGDFGPGIGRGMLPHIFEPFVTTDDARGSGLGLAIAHELAERMDGDLAVESQPGRTTFILELPRRPAPAR